MPDPVQVTIGDITATLQPVGITRAAGLAIDVEDPRAQDPSYVLAVSAACLRAAWPEDVKWPARKRPRKHKLGSDVADYGEAVLDELYPASGMTLAALGEAPDLYLIHSVTPESPALADASLLDALRRLTDDGVRVGISTSGPEQGAVIDAALALTDSPFSVVQATWNLLEPSVGPALARAHSDGWLVVVKEAMANGRLAGDASPIATLATKDGQTADAFALGAALAQPWADLVLSGAVTVDQLRSNLAARAPGTPAAELAPLALDARDYWTARSAREWA